VWDGIALMPQLAAVLTGRGGAIVASLGSQPASVPATASAVAPATAAASASAQPAQSASIQDDADAWKNKWVYLGGGLGYGGYTYTNWNRKVTGSVFAPGFIIDFALLPFFSIEADFSIAFGEDGTNPMIPILIKLGGKFAQVELSFDLGYVLGVGYTLGGTFGIHAGRGILFAKYLNIPDASPIYGFMDSAWVVFVGYKVGVGKGKG